MNIYNWIFAGLLFFAQHVSAQYTGWALLHGKNAIEWENLPMTLDEKLQSMKNRPNLDMHYVAIPHSLTGWMLIYHSGDPNGVVSYNKSWEEVPRDLVEQVQKLCDEKQFIRQVVFFQNGGWLILYGKNECLWKLIPPGLASKIVQFHQKGLNIETIATTRDGGWLIIGDRNEFYGEQLPEPLMLRLQALRDMGAVVRNVAFDAGGGWILLYTLADQFQFDYYNVPEKLILRLQELQQKGITPKSVSFWSLPKLSIDGQ